MKSEPVRDCFVAAARARPLRPLAWAVCALIATGAAGCKREGATAPAAAAAPSAAIAAPAVTPPASPAPAAAGVAVTGEVGDLRLRAIDTLPPPLKVGGEPGEVSGGCSDAAISAEARAAEAAGWTVFAERDWAGYRAVGVARIDLHLAGMGCVFPGGRLLLFRAGRPVAQVFDPHADRPDSDGGVQSLEEGAPQSPAESAEFARRDDADAELRVGRWNGSELARLRIGAHGGLELAALPAMDNYCGGRAKLPRLERLDLPVARERLLTQGWRPDRPEADEGEDGMRETLRGLGFPELEGCAGTGMGYCNFHYRNAAGDRLKLTSAGEYMAAEGERAEVYWPKVAGYGVQCAAPGRG